MLEEMRSWKNNFSLLDNFETASLPTTSPEERKRLLSFVVCGGGPTGVETAAVRFYPDRSLHDVMSCDSRKYMTFAKKTLSIMSVWQLCLYVNFFYHHVVVSQTLQRRGFDTRYPVSFPYLEHCKQTLHSSGLHFQHFLQYSEAISKYAEVKFTLHVVMPGSLMQLSP